MRANVVALLLLCSAAVLANNDKSGTSLLPLERESATCATCRTTIEQAMGYYTAGDPRPVLVEKLTALCTDLGKSPVVCRGTVELNIDIAMWIMEAKSQTEFPLTPSGVCGFSMYPECDLIGAQFNWTLDLSFLGPKPSPQEPQLPPNGYPTMKVLQLTDVHVDPNYLPGGNAVCDEPFCCRADQGPPANESNAAGYWGDYRGCDVPVHTFQDMLRHAAEQNPDISYVMFTGDIIDHAVWATSNQYNTDLITFVMDQIDLFFPGVTVLPILGNHESSPCNIFSSNSPEIPASVSSGWMYQLIADVWGRWLPPTARPSILQGGFYSLEVKPGLQAVVMNSMFCYNSNWWLMYDNADPSGELMWLAGELLMAEAADKKVHILMHHPAGFKDCMHMWSSEYRRIIDRFESTVVAQFHGHTHNDHFSIYYDLADSSRATNVAWTAGSGTSYSDVNMNYRLYTVDGDYQGSTFRVLDHDTWFFNLTEANLAGSEVTPNWQKLYSFNEAYGTASLLPMEMDALVRRMATDVDLQQQYYRFLVKQGDTELAEGCDAACARRLMCQILTTVNGDVAKCDEILPQVIA